MKEPLAFRMRPETLDDVIGQKHLIGNDMVIRRCIEEQRIFSMIFYGPPGTGKTTLATVIAKELKLPYKMFNAVTGNKKDLEIIFTEAKLYPGLILIVDEVHRLNKDKQDLLLPHVENGNITLIGATTSNPYHAINPAIRSRCHLFEIKQLFTDDIKEALLRSIQSTKGLDNKIKISEDALDLICKHCNGDIRYALNVLEICAISCKGDTIDTDLVLQYSAMPNMSLDSNGDGYYDVLSAFQKSIRGSDVDAALYYLGIMIMANDLDSIERRLLVTAYEDVGLGNPAAVARCVQACDAARRIGFPEARIILSLAVIDVTLSPKSKSAEHAIDYAMQALKNDSYQVPDYLKFTPVNMKKEDAYPYDRSDIWPYIQYLPDKLKHSQFYYPELTSQYEKVLAENFKKIKSNSRSSKIALLKERK